MSPSWTGVKYCIFCWVDVVFCVQLHEQLHLLGSHGLWCCGEIRVGEVKVWLKVKPKWPKIGVLYIRYLHKAPDS
jgi:hypothetical protein